MSAKRAREEFLVDYLEDLARDIDAGSEISVRGQAALQRLGTVLPLSSYPGAVLPTMLFSPVEGREDDLVDRPNSREEESRGNLATDAARAVAEKERSTEPESAESPSRRRSYYACLTETTSKTLFFDPTKVLFR